MWKGTIKLWVGILDVETTKGQPSKAKVKAKKKQIWFKKKKKSVSPVQDFKSGGKVDLTNSIKPKHWDYQR